MVKWNKCIGDSVKAAVRQSPNCIKKTKNINKIWRKNDFQCGGWNYYTLQCGTQSWHWFRQLTAPCKCGMWLWNHDGEFTKWQHPAMWYVALGSWHWIRLVATPCNVAGGSGMTCHGIRPNVRRIGILHLVSTSTISHQSTCHSAPVWEILCKSEYPQQKRMSYRFSRSDYRVRPWRPYKGYWTKMWT